MRFTATGTTPSDLMLDFATFIYLQTLRRFMDPRAISASTGRMNAVLNSNAATSMRFSPHSPSMPLVMRPESATTTSKPIEVGCATESFMPPASAPRQVLLNRAAKGQSAFVSNAVACSGPCPGPTQSSPFVAAGSADDSRTSGRDGHPRLLHEPGSSPWPPAAKRGGPGAISQI